MTGAGNMSGPANSNKREAGYMLMEMLVSLALVALLSIGLVSSISGGMRIWEISDSRSEALSEEIALESVFRRHLSRAVPVSIVAGRRTTLIYFEGSPHRIRFFTTAEAGVSTKGVYGEEMQLRRVGRKTELVIHRSRVSLGEFETAVPAEWDEAIISLGREDKEFTFYATNPRSHLGAWTESWQGQRSLPVLIGIKPVREASEADKPEIVVAPRISTSSIRLLPETLKAYFANSGG